MVAILHIETLVTFDFTPLISHDWLLTPIKTETNEFSGIYW